MRIFGIGISTTILSLIISSYSIAQCSFPCASAQCGQLNVGFSPGGGIEFCEGIEIVFTNTSSAGFEFFVIEWNDGQIDTVYNYGPVSHTYVVADSNLCLGNKLITVCFRGILNCANGQTCASGTYNFSLKVRPKAQINLQQQYCIENTVQFLENACNEKTYAWSFGDGGTSSSANPTHIYSTPGPKNIQLIVTNDCGADTAFKQIVIVQDPLPQVSWNQQDDTICVDQVVALTDITSTYGGATWIFPPLDTTKWEFTDTLMNANSDFIAIHFKKQGTYFYRLKATNACGTAYWDQQIVVLDGPTISLQNGPELCISNPDYNPFATYTNQNQIQSYQWSFSGGTPSASSLSDPGIIMYSSAGNYPVILTIQSTCGPTADTTTVTIDDLPAIIMPAVPALYCSGSMPDTLIAQPPGGAWSGPGISSNGIFDPGSVPPGATYTLTYTAQNGICQASSSIDVFVAMSASVTVQDTQVCQDARAFNLMAMPSGGTWSGAGVVDPSGIFDPAVSGVGVFYPVYQYADINGCLINVNADVIIQSFPQSVMSDTTVLCNENILNSLADALQLNLTPSGGDTLWTFDGLVSNGFINGSGLSGFHHIELSYKLQSCSIEDSATVQFITPIPLMVSADTLICINNSPYTLQSNLTGVWAGPGVDPFTGIVDLTIAGGGPKTYTFVSQEGTSCEQRDTVTLIIQDPGVNLNAGLDVSLCEGQQNSYIFSGATPSGGYWIGAGITDSVAGQFDITQLLLDSSYTYLYCLPDANLPSCLACDLVTVVVHSLPNADFSISGSPCQDIPFSLSADTCDLTSNYLWSLGDGNAGSGCSQMHTYTTAGDFILSLEVQSEFGCIQNQNQNIHVSAPPVASFSILNHEGCAPFPVEVTNLSSGEINQHQWIVGQDTIFGFDPGVIIVDGLTADTLIPVQLEVSNGCAVVSIRDTVLVHPYPVVHFGFTADEGCSPLLIEFGNSTLGNPVTWLWDLGNGLITTDSIPAPQVYTTLPDSVSIYAIQLISSNACGADTLTQTITVFPPDVTAFLQLDTLTGCEPLTVPAHSFSTPGSTIGWQVIGPNGFVTGSTDIDPVFTLHEPGTHMIILSAARCGMDFDTGYVEVLPAPVIDFVTDPIACQDATIEFENLSQDVTSILWDFGDGNQSTDYSSFHVYAVPGTYTVTLVAHSLINNCPQNKRAVVEVLPKPILNVDTLSKIGCPPLQIDFQNQGPSGLSYVWHYGDNTPLDTLMFPSHVFTYPGQFLVNVFAFDANGCFSDTATIPVTIHPVPESRFEILSPRLCEDHDTLFTSNISSGANSYYWLVNGDTIPGNPLTYLPDTAGSYLISLIAENTYSCRDTSTRIMEILESPRADFIPLEDQGCAPVTTKFINSSSGSTHYVWNFGDGNTSTDISPQHIFSDSGQFKVVLIALQSNGCPDDTADGIIQVFPVPQSNFDFMKSAVCGVPMDVDFINLSTGQQDNEWVFGDVGFSDQTHPTHTYASAGIFSVRLIVSNLYGCRDTSESAVEIYEQPVADFVLDRNVFCANDLISIQNSSLHSLLNCWLINDSLISMADQLELTLQDTGNYRVTLIAKYNSYCIDTFVFPLDLEIYTSPAADFIYSADQIENIIGDVQFTNLSVDYNRVEWDFGDGETTSIDDPFHEYDINRHIDVTLYAFNDNQGRITCIDTVVKPIDPEWILTFYAPNAFSPGYGDSLVSVFKPVGIGLAEYDMSVYSPWGQRVWHTNLLEDTHPVESWNGKLNNTGDILPQGSFTWLAKILFVNGVRKVYKGSVTLLR